MITSEASKVPLMRLKGYLLLFRDQEGEESDDEAALDYIQNTAADDSDDLPEDSKVCSQQTGSCEALGFFCSSPPLMYKLCAPGHQERVESFSCSTRSMGQVTIRCQHTHACLCRQLRRSGKRCKILAGLSLEMDRLLMAVGTAGKVLPLGALLSLWSYGSSS